jgi:hypothetical protein
MYLTEQTFMENLKIWILIFQIKTAITFAYGLKKKVWYMKNYLDKILHPISTAYGRLHNFLLLKIPKENMKEGRF